ncbi:MAG: hypothetical protein QNJ00_12420 [Woeseiaceae bacterium]|nr:hypothetical protein [Woeseiaceae bacterium]
MQKIKEGALFGLGFTVVAIAVVMAFVFIVEQFEKYDAEPYVAPPPEDVVIGDTRIEEREDRLVVLGSLENNGLAPVSYFDLRVNLFGENDLFLDQCEVTFDQVIEPSSTAYFKIRCSACNDVPLEDVVRHEVFEAGW